MFAFQDFYDEQGVFAENFWPQSEPPQAMAFNPRGRVSKALTPPPTTQSINNQVSRRAEAQLCEGSGTVVAVTWRKASRSSGLPGRWT